MWRHFLKEAAASLWRHRLGNLLSLATITASLFILSLLLLGVNNLGAIVRNWSRQIQVSVFLEDGVSPATREAVSRLLRETPEVESFEYLSKEEALERFRRQFSGLSHLPDTLGENPLPASFELRITEGYRTPAAVTDLAGRLRVAAGVAMVRYDFEWIRKLQFLIRGVRYGGLALASLLILASIVTIANAISLSLFSRRSEIEIMRLVGATRWYIQGPFLLEGAVQGGLGALLALGALSASIHMFTLYLVPVQHPLLELFPFSFLPTLQKAAILIGGMGMGISGSLISIRRWTTI